MTPETTQGYALPMPLAPRPAPRPQRSVSGRMAERRRRLRVLRRRVVALGVAAFVAMWCVMYVQLASGHDPALSTKTASVATATVSNASAATTATTPSVKQTSSSSGTSGSASSSGTSGSSQASSVTTRQS